MVEIGIKPLAHEQAAGGAGGLRLCAEGDDDVVMCGCESHVRN